MTKKLFEDFEAVTSKAWKQKIHVDLKGADYNDTLIWSTNEDINVKPFYHQDDLEAEKPLPVTSNPWTICQTIFVADTKLSNKKALDAITRGAESITFIIPNKDVSISSLLQNITVSAIPLHFKLQFLDTDYVSELYTISPNHITVHTDIIGNLAKTGNWFSNHEYDVKALETIITTNPSALSVHADLYQNAGANSVQQLAYAIAHANEYLNSFGDKLTAPITFNIAVGTNYFFEIAKLRALRVLWKTLAKEYGANTDCHIYVTPSKRNKTIYDYNTNMLRTTTECMSAILGGANTICNLAYDAIYHKDNEFGERIARNQLLILKHESYFDAVENASDGSYYIENLTTQLAEKALNLFKTIEDNGGFLSGLHSGSIQKKIKENAQKELEQFNSKALILLGTNKHPNPNDKMKSELELYPFLKMNTRKTLIEPIIEKRIAEAAEQNRLNQE